MAVLHNPIRIIPLCLAVTLSACATPEGDFPSLERRPFETASPEAAPAPAAPTELTPALTEKIRAITGRHKRANEAFNRALPRLQAIAERAAGSAQGSETWVNAHLELSRLDHNRADSVAALGELDELIAAQADSDSTYVVLLSAYQEPVANEVTAQRSAVERLSQLIGE
jgi:hypothetical protein